MSEAGAVPEQPGSGGSGRSATLVLGAGGARGLAHIGAIEVLIQRGYQLRAIAGSSMGALVGGIHAAGRLAAYRDWARSLQKLDVLRLVDWTLSGGGFIRGERVIAALRELVGEVRIESLPIAFTAVASDLDNEREVWLSRGPLFDAIRASIAIPGLLTPVRIESHTLVDGGLLNPLPMDAALHAISDVTIAVSLNGSAQRLRVRWEPPAPAAPAPEPAPTDLRARMTQLLESLMERRPGATAPTVAPGWRELLSRSFETMQGALTRLKLATHAPDVLIEIPRNSCAFYEFYRAEELIALGRDRATRALDEFEARRFVAD
jgi:NTE family protein